MIAVRINVMLMDVITSPIIPQQAPIIRAQQMFFCIPASFLLFGKDLSVHKEATTT